MESYGITKELHLIKMLNINQLEKETMMITDLLATFVNQSEVIVCVYFLLQHPLSILALESYKVSMSRQK